MNNLYRILKFTFVKFQNTHYDIAPPLIIYNKLIKLISKIIFNCFVRGKSLIAIYY